MLFLYILNKKDFIVYVWNTTSRCYENIWIRKAIEAAIAVIYVAAER